MARDIDLLKQFEAVQVNMTATTDSDGPMTTCLDVATQAFGREGLPPDSAWDFHWGGAPCNAERLVIARRQPQVNPA